MSDIFVVNIDDGLYQSYENVITLNDYTIKGITSLVNIPENINISSNSKFTITANFNENKISGLSIDYDKNNKK